MGFVLFLLLALYPKPNYCSCIPLPPIDDKQYNDYNLIAKGKVVKITMNNMEENIYFAIDTCYKGDEREKTLKITSPGSEGMCGIFPKVGEDWLMFVHRDGKNYKTHLCTRTKIMNPKAWNYNEEELTSDLTFLRAKLTGTN